MQNLVYPLSIVLMLISWGWSFSGKGSGTKASPYQITTIEQLQEMQDDTTGYYVLMNDIDASITQKWNSPYGFEPIVQFAGFLDGQGHTIRHLFINRSYEERVGLLGSALKAYIVNVKIVEAVVTGKTHVGILVGSSFMTTYKNCHVSGKVTGISYIGGFVGYSTQGDSVYASSADVEVVSTSSGVGNSIGGFVGNLSRGSLFECYAKATVSVDSTRYVGGFAGFVYFSTFQNSYVTGHLFSSKGVSYMGGAFGSVKEVQPLNTYAWVSTPANSKGFANYHVQNGGADSCFWNKSLATRSDARARSLTTSEFSNQSIFVKAGWDFNSIWEIEKGFWDNKPFLRWQRPHVAATSLSTTLKEDFGKVTVLDLSTYFLDAESPVSDMSYSVLSNDNPALLEVAIQNNKLVATSVANAYGSAKITLQAKDADGLSVSSVFTIKVQSVNDKPYVLSSFASLKLQNKEDFGTWQVLDLATYFRDVETTTSNLKFAVSAAPVGVLKTTLSGSLIQASSVENAYGDVMLTITVTDADGGSYQDSIQISVEPVNDAPYGTEALKKLVLEQDEDFGADVVLVDLATLFADAETASSGLIYQMTATSSIATLSLKGSVLSASSVPDSSGDVAIKVKVSDGVDSLTELLTLTIHAVNDVPYLDPSFAALSLEQDEDFGQLELLNLADYFLDKESKSSDLVYSVVNRDSSIVSVSLQGSVLSATSMKEKSGVALLYVSAEDEGGAVTTDSLILTIHAINDPPYLTADFSSVVLSLDEDFAPQELLDLTQYFRDDLQTPSSLHYTASLKDSDLVAISLQSGVIAATSKANQNGQTLLYFSAEDSLGAKTVDSIPVTIQPVQDPLVFLVDLDAFYASGTSTLFDLDTMLQSLDYPLDSLTFALKTLSNSSNLKVQMSRHKLVALTKNNAKVEDGVLSVELTITTPDQQSVVDTFKVYAGKTTLVSPTIHLQTPQIYYEGSGRFRVDLHEGLVWWVNSQGQVLARSSQGLVNIHYTGRVQAVWVRSGQKPRSLGCWAVMP